MIKPKVDIGAICKFVGLGLMLVANVVTGVAEKKQSEAYLSKLFNEKFADKK